MNAWGGPAYLDAMVCHYLDGALIMAISAWLLSKVLLPAPARLAAVSREPAATVTTAKTRN